MFQPDTSPTYFPAQTEIEEVLNLVRQEAATYLEGLDRRAARAFGSGGLSPELAGSLPDVGSGAALALRQLLDHGLDSAVHSSGPRCFHFVIGGVTPAALGADWLATVLDQMAYAWIASPLAVELELVSLSWLKELFDLPAGLSGVMTTGATMANFVGLGAARQWWGEQQGVDVAQQGLTGLPAMSIFTSGLVHASIVKTAAMLGLGRSSVRVFSRDASGIVDIREMERALKALNGTPAVIVGNAGEVNAGRFDPLDILADLAESHGAWLHVDGAFGLFARVSPRTRGLTAGVERADSVTVDGHKWLNVPYDCGFAFVRDAQALGNAFAYTGAYLPKPDDPHPNMGSIGPESSRRARSLAVWATLRAYGRSGYQALVERCLNLAQRMAERVGASADLERLDDVPLNIVCFRYNPGGLGEERLNEINDALGRAIVDDGRFYAGTTLHGGKVALRPALVNWRTTPPDVDDFVEVVRELGARVARQQD